MEEEEFDFSDIVETDPKKTSSKTDEAFDFTDILEPQNEQEQSLLSQIGENTGKFIGSVNRGLAQTIAAPLKFVGAVEETLGGVGYATRAGQAVEDFTEYFNPEDPNFNPTANAVGEGLGQGLAMLASGGVSGGSSALTQTATKVPGLLPALGKAALSKPAVLGGTMTAVPEWEQAKEAGLSDEEAFSVLLKNYLVGQTEALPIQNLLGRLNKVTGNRLLEIVKAQGVGALEEGTQEALQTYLSNEIAKDEYDPDRDPLFQVLESAEVGGIVGFILPGMVGLAKSLPAEKRVKLERKLAEVQVNDEIKQSSTGDPILDAQIDAPAEINPVDKKVLEEIKIADAIVEEQKEKESEEKITLDIVNKEAESVKNNEQSDRSESVRDNILKSLDTNTPTTLKVSLLKDIIEFDRAKMTSSDDKIGRKNIDNIKKSIAEKGLEKPLEVIVNSKGNILLAEGNHRIIALDELGYTEVPVIVRQRSNTLKNILGEKAEQDYYYREGQKLGLNLNLDFGNKGPNAENTKSKSAKSAEKEVPVSSTPEYKIALQALEDVKAEFDALPMDASEEQSLAAYIKLQKAKGELQKLAQKSGVKPKTKKTDLQKQIEDTTGVTKPEKSVKMTPSEAIKFQIQNYFKGVDRGVKKGAELKNDLVSKVQEAIKEYPLETKQVNTILTKLRNTNLYTPGSISRLNSFIDKVSQDAEYADKLSEAKSINKKLRKLAKASNSNLQNYKGIAKSFASINPEDTFINKHLEQGRKILSGLTSPTREGYAPIDVAGAEEYITDLQSKIETEEETVREKDGDKRSVQLFENLRSSLDALNEKDLSEFDESEIRTIETLKNLDPSTLTDDQATSVVRVIDNIVENDDFSNSAAVTPIIKAKQVLKDLTSKYADVKKAEIRAIGKLGATTYQQFARVFGDSGIAADVQQQTGILDVLNAGSRVEKQEIQFSKDFKDKIKEVNRKYKTTVQDLDNQVLLSAFANLAKNYGDDSHITKVKGNIQRTISEYSQTEPTEAKAWQKAWNIVKDVETVEEVIEKFKQYPALYEVWQFNKGKFKANINEKLGATRTELYNKPYVEADNYSHTSFTKTSKSGNTSEEFLNNQSQKRGSIKARESKTGLTATFALPRGSAYTSDWISSQIKGYRESLYDIETSRANALVRETLLSPEFEQLVGGRNNANIILDMIDRAEAVQRGVSQAAANDAMKLLNGVTQGLRQVGATRALGSISQPLKQVPSVWTKAFFNHIGTGSLDSFFKGVGAINLVRTSPNLKKLFDQYTISVRGERLGGIERGDAVGFRLSPGATKKLARALENIAGFSENASRIALKPLTMSDTYAARTTWLGYYLQKLKEQGVTDVDLNSEYLKQNDPKRQTAAAYAEQLVSETQVPSNPAALSQISRNENDGSWNFVKNIILPFSTFSLNAKYRNIQNVDKLIRNPNVQNAAAVGGDMVEIAAFASIVYGLSAYYKDWLKALLEDMIGVSSEGDDEKDEQNRKKAFYGNITNSALPFAIGQGGEYLVSKLANNLAYLYEDPDVSYDEWRKETGGLLFEPDTFDAGVYSLGFEIIADTYTGAKNLGEDEIEHSEFGRTKEVSLTPAQQNLLAIKFITDAMATAGISEADLFNSIEKIYKEQMRAGDKPANNPNPTRQRIRPRPRIRARNLK